MKDLIEILDFIRSLQAGGLFGGGLMGIIYLLLPGFFSPAVPLEMIIIIGALFGGGCQKLLTPVSEEIVKNWKDNQEKSRKEENLKKRWQVLNMSEVYGYIPPSEASEMKAELLKEYILPESERRQIRGNSED